MDVRGSPILPPTYYEYGGASVQKNLHTPNVQVLTHTDTEMAARLSRYNTVSTYLKGLKDLELQALVANGTVLHSGIGGEVLRLEVKGIPFVAKKIRLTGQEPQNGPSTRNHFELPMQFQYGVGSCGFGAWRELTSHQITTEWVLQGECQNFPLMYHHAVLFHSTVKPPLSEEQKEVQKKMLDSDANWWEDNKAIRERQEAVVTSTDNIVVFLEFLPQTLEHYMQGEESEEAIFRVEKEIMNVSEFMKSQGFIHFDGHFRNILATKDHIYFADFGLSVSNTFELSLEERTFFEKNKDFDRSHSATGLVLNIIGRAAGSSKQQRMQDVDAYFKTGRLSDVISAPLATILTKYTPIAKIMLDFFHKLTTESKTTPFPEQELAREWAAIAAKK